MDFVLDTNRSAADAKLITAETFRAGMDAAVRSPFRVVPFFDPGVWGGQWMKRVCGLDDETENYAWCFDCVPEENSLLLDVAGELVELPSIDLVFTHPRELLGELTFARFGAEFPIRFDFLDTMEGGNLSLQVHPLTDYIQDTFGMHYTQDESYYLLDAADHAVVYLGLKSGIDPEAMVTSLGSASRGELSFPAEEFVNAFPAKKHDHFSIPAGTVHCSGADSMVLEISATPYLFTFKMWDWDRVGLDGVPRPIHLEHARRNIQWDRDTAWTRDNLVGQVETLGSGPGWVEERTGLHALEFIEVRRHWFTDVVEHDTAGTVNVLNLVEGAEAVVESPTGSFAPFVVHYAETFIVPAQVGRYRIRPHGAGVGSGWPRSRRSCGVPSTEPRSVPLVHRPEGGAQERGVGTAFGGTDLQMIKIGRDPGQTEPDRRLDDVPRAGDRAADHHDAGLEALDERGQRGAEADEGVLQHGSRVVVALPGSRGDDVHVGSRLRRRALRPPRRRRS